MSTDKPSIAELRRLEADDGHPLQWEAAITAHGSVLLEIAAAAKEFEPELAYVLGPLSARLREALAKVRK